MIQDFLQLRYERTKVAVLNFGLKGSFLWFVKS